MDEKRVKQLVDDVKCDCSPCQHTELGVGHDLTCAMVKAIQAFDKWKRINGEKK